MSMPFSWKRFKTRADVVPLSMIDTEDHTCLLNPHFSPASVLLESLQNVGLISPPLVWGKKDGLYGIVCGFRRIEACNILGWQKIDVQILQGAWEPFDLLQCAIWDNRSHRPLNVVEQAHAMDKLGPFIPQERRLAFFSSLLGFPLNKKVLQKIAQIASLPETVQVGLVEGKMSLEAAVSLSDLAPGDGVVLFDLLAKLKMSQNKQKELVTQIREIAIIENLTVSDVLRSLGVGDILKNRELNRNEKGATIRKRLKQRRFPTLTRVEATFKESVKALKLDKNMHIVPPPYFEGQSYVLRFDFKCLKDLDHCRKNLDALIKNPATKRLLEPYDE